MSLERPEDVSDKVAQLGEPRAEFAVRGRRLFRKLIVAPVLILAGVGIEVLVLAGGRVHNHEIVLLGIILTVSGVMLVVRAYRNRGLRVLVFPEGIVCLRRHEAHAFRWEEIERVWHKKSGAAHWARAWRGALVVVVQRADGEAMSLDDSLPRLKELGEILQRETLPYLWPRFLASYEAGDTLEFGKLGVSRRGLSHQAESLAWRDVQEIKFNEQGEVVIHKKGKWTHWFRGTISDIPNFHVLRALVDGVLQERSSSK